MSRSFIQQSFNEDLSHEWEEAYNKKVTNSTFNHYNTIFSDDEEDESPSFPRWFPQSETILASSYTDPVLSSSTYHIHQADNALSTLKHAVQEKEGWKKALKHKSGVVVHMKNGLHKGDKTPIFKGEAIIQGFSPQAIFYVIGMRKLWDEQYEDGNLVENLNDTTSLTYEVMKPTTASKSKDLALVEKIECTQNGSIVFACTSVESSRIPRINGRTRGNIKLQGWILEPLHMGPLPATKIIFVVQESMKGWVPGFAKKSLARRPLVIAKVAEYLEKKTERMKQQQIQQQKKSSSTSSFMSINQGYNRRPSVLGNPAPQSRSVRLLSKPTSSADASPQHSILVQNHHQPSPVSSIVSQPQGKKHISFADHDITVSYEDHSSSASTATDNTIPRPTNTAHLQPQKPVVKNTNLYPTHRHPIQKVESIQLLKKLTSSLDNWNLTKELEDGASKYYLLSRSLQFSDDEDNPYIQHQKRMRNREEKRKVPFIRADSVIEGGWTAEQLCSVIQCFGSRKIWDSSFEGGRIVERFSQKEYLVQWFLGGMIPIASVDLSAVTSIETDPVTGTVYTATASVTDEQVPPDESGHRIRAYTDLYGWVFKPNLDKNGRTVSVAISFVCNMDFRYVIPEHIVQTWIDSSLQAIQHLSHYLSHYGCPPYIRRVAGKITHEEFDTLTNHYKMIYTVKHQPSSSYRARKQNQPNSLWCTDVRFDQNMFLYGLDIIVQPENVVRVQVSFKQRSIKMFTIDEDIDNKPISFTLIPLSKHDHGVPTYRYNGEWVYGTGKSQTKPQLDQTIKPTVESKQSQLKPLKLKVSKKLSIPKIETEQQMQLSVPTLTVEEYIDAESPKADLVSEPELTKTGTVPSIKGDQIQTESRSSKPSLNTATVNHIVTEVSQNETDIQQQSKIDTGSCNSTEEIEKKEEKSSVSLNVPKGYLLVPEHQNANIIMITDELSFNAQQLSVIFLVMVVCYYMGKFTSCNSC